VLVNLTFRAVLIALILSVLSIFWVHQSSLVQAPGTTMWLPEYLLSVPPVPAIFCLILLVAIIPLTTRFFGKALSKKELIFIYMVLVIAIPPRHLRHYRDDPAVGYRACVL